MAVIQITVALSTWKKDNLHQLITSRIHQKILSHRVYTDAHQNEHSATSYAEFIHGFEIDQGMAQLATKLSCHIFWTSVYCTVC